MGGGDGKDSPVGAGGSVSAFFGFITELFVYLLLFRDGL